MASSPKRVNMVAATNLRTALLGIPMGATLAGGGAGGAGAAVVSHDGYRGDTWAKPHTAAGGAVDYSCGNFALTGGTNAFFGPAQNDFGTVLGAMLDPNLPGTGHHVCYNSGPPAMAGGALNFGGAAHVYGGQYRYINNGVADDNAPIYQDIPALYTPPGTANNAHMPAAVGGVAYALTDNEWTRLRTLRTAALTAGIPWKKVGLPGPIYRTTDPDSTWGDGLRNLRGAAYAALNANEEAILRNHGANHNSAAMRFFHKLMKRVAELSGWKIKDYAWSPAPTIGQGLVNALGIAVTSIAPWGADHWGFVVTNAAMPNPGGAAINMRYAFFQQVAGMNGTLDCYGTRLWDEGRPISVLWVDQAPQAVINQIIHHYH